MLDKATKVCGEAMEAAAKENAEGSAAHSSIGAQAGRYVFRRKAAKYDVLVFFLCDFVGVKLVLHESTACNASERRRIPLICGSLAWECMCDFWRLRGRVLPAGPAHAQVHSRKCRQTPQDMGRFQMLQLVLWLLLFEAVGSY